MKIVTSMHLALATAATTAVAFAVAALAFHNIQRESIEQRQTLNRIVQGVAELHIRADEYMDRSRFDIRPLQQWRTRDDAITADLQRIRADTPEAKQLIRSLTARHHEMEQLFMKLISLRATADSDNLAHIQLERLLGRLFVMFEEQFAEADELRRMSDAADRDALTYAVAFGAVALALMMASVLLCAAIVRRNLSAPLHRLLAATEAIGSGRLDHRIGSADDDEIGALSRAFDTMAERLQQVTASRNELVHAKASLRRLNATLEERVARRTAALERAHEQLHHAQKMEAVGQLTGGIAHDFNNLLASIVGNVEMMRVRLEQKRFDDLPRYVDAVMSVADRATALTHRLLAFSRRQALNPRPVNVHELVTSMHELIQRTVGPAIRIDTTLKDTPCITLCDSNQLESAILNLAINARDAMPNGGVLTIDVARICIASPLVGDIGGSKTSGMTEPGDYIAIAVSDTGTGMTPEIVARAFDPFFTTKPSGQGTGLGLSMVYGFVKQSGGHVAIDSQPGRGTTVKLYLPRHHGNAEPATDGGKQASSRDVTRAERKANVLVVEDEPEVRKTVVEMLQELGYAATATVSAEECLRILQSPQTFDLLITDVGLPGGMDGWQLAGRAREARSSLKVLLITGYAQDDTVLQCPLKQDMDVLVKPFSMDVFAVKVRNMMAPAEYGHGAEQCAL